MSTYPKTSAHLPAPSHRFATLQRYEHASDGTLVCDRCAKCRVEIRENHGGERFYWRDGLHLGDIEDRKPPACIEAALD